MTPCGGKILQRPMQGASAWLVDNATNATNNKQNRFFVGFFWIFGPDRSRLNCGFLPPQGASAWLVGTNNNQSTTNNKCVIL